MRAARHAARFIASGSAAKAMAWACELVYGKGPTPFLRLTQNAGVRRLADGVGMRVEQATEAFFWWRGGRPDTRAVIDRLTLPLTWPKATPSNQGLS